VSDDPTPEHSRFAPDFLTEMFRNPLDPGYAAAARRRDRSGTPPGRAVPARTARTLVLVLAGFLLAVAYQQTVAAQPERARVRAGLVADVTSRQAETDALRQRAEQLRDAVARQRDAALAGTGLDTTRLSNLEVAGGLVTVTGDGAVVRLGDAPAPADPVTGKASGANLGQVLDQDLQDVANELWHQGAEAVSINGERLTATSTIRTAGSTILVNFRPLRSPYEVTAIGPPDLDRRFSLSSTGRRFSSYALRYGMQVSVRHASGLSLAAAAEPQLHYAQPFPTGSPSPSSGRPVGPSVGPGASGATPTPSGGR